MNENKEWKRPQDVVTFRTSDPKEMLGKYLPKPVLKTWTEDFLDEDTGETVSIERNEVIMQAGGEITQDKLQQLLFAIQAGDIKDVEVCDEDVQPMSVQTANYLIPYSLELERWGMTIVKDHYVCYAQDINQAIRIATEFGQMYRGFSGDVKVNRVVRMDARLVPDNHQCIPEDDRKPADERKDYFKVQVRREYIENMKLKHYDTYYIVHAKDVGEAKERIALLLEIMKAEDEQKNGKQPEDPDSRTTIRKALPFEVDCIVPRVFSELYFEEIKR